MLNCMIKPFYSSLPFLLLVFVLYVVFSFCDDYQFINVSRCGSSSWLSRWWKLRCI